MLAGGGGEGGGGMGYMHLVQHGGRGCQADCARAGNYCGGLDAAHAVAVCGGLDWSDGGGGNGGAAGALRAAAGCDHGPDPQKTGNTWWSHPAG
eukprot:scaffold41284_cov17-Tisochrysis_lutea.AAC.1